MATTSELLDFVDSITELSVEELDAIISKTRVRLLTLEAMRRVRTGTEVEPAAEEAPRKHKFPKEVKRVPLGKTEPKVKRKYIRRAKPTDPIATFDTQVTQMSADELVDKVLGYQGTNGHAPADAPDHAPEEVKQAEPTKTPSMTMNDRVKDYRQRRVLELLAKNDGPIKQGDIVKQLVIPNGSITTTLDHEWFTKDQDGVRLTGFGMVAAERAGYMSPSPAT